MPQIVGFNHFGVTVGDMERALKFWCELLGLQLLGQGVVEYQYLDRIVGLDETRIEWAELALPKGGLIELFRYLNPAGKPVTGAVNDVGKTHLCLEVEDLDGLLGELHAAGIRSACREPVEIPRGNWRGFR